MAVQIFKAILITTLCGTFLTVFITFIKPITKKIFSFNWHYYIWLAVLMVMILPVRFTMPNIEKNVNNDSKKNEVIFNNSQIQVVPTNEIIPETNIQTGDELQADTLQNLQQSNAKKQFKINEINLSIFALIWLLGMGAVLLINIAGYVRLLYKVRRRSVKLNCPEIKNYTNRKIIVCAIDNLSSPFIMGIFKPRLVLPNIELTPDELDNILIHETTHLKRNDILYKWFAVLVKAIHWFNPVIYYVTSKINTECEISCDLAVVKNMNDTQKISYVNTIIALVSQGKTKAIPLTTGMTGNKNTLKRRFTMIKNKINISKKNIVISVILAVIIVGLTVFASGLLNGRIFNFSDNTTIKLDVDKRDGDNFNTLILGVDEQGRADTIMLFIASDDNIAGLSIPRNVQFNNKRIMDILAEENGDQKVIDEIKNNFSIPITYYAKVKIDLIEDLINITGGSLVLDVPGDMHYDDPTQNLHIDLKKGEQRLDGNKICELLRYMRNDGVLGYTDGDLGRIQMGQKVAKAFVSQIDIADIAANSDKIIDSINKNVVTNYSMKNFVKDKNILKNKTIAFYTVPGDMFTGDYYGSSVYEIDYDKLKSALESNNFGTLAPPKIDLKGKTFTYNGDAGKMYITFHENSAYECNEEGFITEPVKGMAFWSVEGDTLFMAKKASNGVTNRFKISENTLTYQAKGSTNFEHIKLKDGDKFYLTAGIEIENE